jgi:hypothetical protein
MFSSLSCNVMVSPPLFTYNLGAADDAALALRATADAVERYAAARLDAARTAREEWRGSLHDLFEADLARLAAAGDALAVRLRRTAALIDTETDRAWEAHRREVAAWLAAQPLPVTPPARP